MKWKQIKLGDKPVLVNYIISHGFTVKSVKFLRKQNGKHFPLRE